MMMELPVGMAHPWEISYPPTSKDTDGCFEKPKKEVVDKRQHEAQERIAEEVFGEFKHYGSDSSTLLLVWKGQPNEEEDDRQRKRCKSSCSLAYEGHFSEGARVVGWPPIGSWRKKLVYQCRVPSQVRNVDNDRRLQRRWNECRKCDGRQKTS